MHKLEAIHDLFHRYANKSYGENITQIEHSLQVAQLAEQQHASDSMIAAGLLHDVGHLLFHDEMVNLGLNDRHEYLGARLLLPLFGDDVAEPVKLHVIAKRYLCAVDAGYYDGLSHASRESLELQGGVLEDFQIKAFEMNPYFEQALQLRHWDDDGKMDQTSAKSFDDYIPLLKQLKIA